MPSCKAGTRKMIFSTKTTQRYQNQLRVLDPQRNRAMSSIFPSVTSIFLADDKGNDLAWNKNEGGDCDHSKQMSTHLLGLRGHAVRSTGKKPCGASDSNSRSWRALQTSPYHESKREKKTKRPRRESDMHQALRHMEQRTTDGRKKNNQLGTRN